MKFNINHINKRLEEVFRKSKEILRNGRSVKKVKTEDLEELADGLSEGTDTGVYTAIKNEKYVGVNFETMCWLMRFNMLAEMATKENYVELCLEDIAKKEAFEGLCNQLALGPTHIIKSFKRNPKLAMKITKMDNGMMWGEKMRENLAEDFGVAMVELSTDLPEEIEKEVVKNLDDELKVWAIGVLEQFEAGEKGPHMAFLNDGIEALGEVVEEVKDEIWFEED